VTGAPPPRAKTRIVAVCPGLVQPSLYRPVEIQSTCQTSPASIRRVSRSRKTTWPEILKRVSFTNCATCRVGEMLTRPVSGSTRIWCLANVGGVSSNSWFRCAAWTTDLFQNSRSHQNATPAK
jgi:hypothetical protein